MDYVLGFMIDIPANRVVLIRKTHPSYQKDRYNGIGGKLKQNESPIEAMCREFKEETDIFTTPEMWTEFAKISSPEYTIYCFKSFQYNLEPTQMTDEIPELLPLNQYNQLPLVNYVEELIILALKNCYATFKVW